MSGVQTKNGKAFEYACLKALQDALSLNQLINVQEDAAFQTAKSSYERLLQADQDSMYIGALAAVNKLRALEPMLENQNGPLILKIQADSNGIHGDVRDVLCIRNGLEHWEIGISCKHNHHAVKHSRLSSTIDFGKEWMGVPCSERYFAKVRPIFDELENTRVEARKQNTIAKWNELSDKEDSVYVPILKAFLEELKCIAHEEGAAERFTSYLIGTKDFYKVIMDEKSESTRIEAMNISGTLNRKSGSIKARIGVPKLKMPTKFLEMRFKRNSKTTIEVLLDEGWSFSMRIHSAKEELEASLKFDINLIGCPSNNYAQTELWYIKSCCLTGS